MLYASYYGDEAMDNNSLGYFIDLLKKKVSEVSGLEEIELDADTTLIDSQSPIQSRELVELMLLLEEHMEDELDVEFDWTSDSAMSEARSIFRNIGSLAEHLYKLSGAK